MMIEGWRYYNHAAIPTCAPHEEPDTGPIDSGSIWTNLGGGVLRCLQDGHQVGIAVTKQIGGMWLKIRHSILVS